MALSPTQVEAALKEAYAEFDTKDMMKEFPLMNEFKKVENKGSKHYDVLVRWQATQGGTHDLPTAITNNVPTKRSSFDVEFKSFYLPVLIEGDALDDAQQKSFREAASLIKSETDYGLMQLMERMNLELYGNGGGSLGQVGSISSDKITLTNPQDSYGFYKGQILKLSADDGTTGSTRSGTVTVKSVDYPDGVITTEANVTSGIAAAAANDYIFIEGDFGNAIDGLQSWIPASDPTGTFLGVDRSVAPIQLAGLRYDGSNKAIDNALESTVQELKRYSGNAVKPDLIMVNPARWRSIWTAFATGAERQVSADGTQLTLGYDKLRVAVGGTYCNVIADASCPVDVAFVLTKSSWEIVAADKLKMVNKGIGWDALPKYDGDEWQIRLKARYNLACRRPGANARVSLAAL